jgi:hypothetical protein
MFDTECFTWKTFYLAYSFSDLLQFLYLVMRHKHLLPHPLHITTHNIPTVVCSEERVGEREKERDRDRQIDR